MEPKMEVESEKCLVLELLSEKATLKVKEKAEVIRRALVTVLMNSAKYWTK